MRIALRAPPKTDVRNTPRFPLPSSFFFLLFAFFLLSAYFLLLLLHFFILAAVMPSLLRPSSKRDERSSIFLAARLGDNGKIVSIVCLEILCFSRIERKFIIAQILNFCRRELYENKFLETNFLMFLLEKKEKSRTTRVSMIPSNLSKILLHPRWYRIRCYRWRSVTMLKLGLAERKKGWGPNRVRWSARHLAFCSRIAVKQRNIERARGQNTILNI